jgi:hypothetical protein
MPQYRRDVPVLTSVIWLFSPVAERWRQDPKRDLWLSLREIQKRRRRA